MAAAAFAAAFGEHFGLGRHLAALEALADEARHHFGDPTQHVLGFDEAQDRRIRVAIVLKVGEAADFLASGLFAVVLLLMKGAAERGHFTIEGHRLVIGKEGLGLLAGALHLAVGHEGFAQFDDLGFDLGGRVHGEVRVGKKIRLAGKSRNICPGVGSQHDLTMKHILAALLLVTLPATAATPEDFTVRAAAGKGSFTLKEARGKFVAVHFLLKTECPLCLKHTRDYLTKAPTLPNVVQVFLKPDSDNEIEAWASKLPAGLLAKNPIYRDPYAKLAKAFDIPDGYKFHGQVVHFPATVLIGPDGKEVFRYIGKSNADRLSFEALAAKVTELSK